MSWFKDIGNKPCCSTCINLLKPLSDKRKEIGQKIEALTNTYKIASIPFEVEIGDYIYKIDHAGLYIVNKKDQEIYDLLAQSTGYRSDLKSYIITPYGNMKELLSLERIIDNFHLRYSDELKKQLDEKMTEH